VPGPRPPLPAAPAAPAGPSEPGGALCPPGSLPDRGVCIPVPRAPAEAPPGPVAAPGHDIPKRTELPAELSAYVLPVTGTAGAAEAAQAAPTATLPGGPALPGLWLGAPLGAEVAVPELAGQQGRATVLAATELVGPTVVTAHRVREGGHERQYLVVAGNLQALPALTPGADAPAVAGRVGDALTPGAPALYLDIRRPREGVDPRATPPEQWLAPSRTLSVDPRNVLPRRGD
jgi:hypothetical protein